MEGRGFAIGLLDAGQLLRHMRITLNQQIHVRTSFEQAHYVLWQTDWFLVWYQVSSRPFHDLSHVSLLKLTIIVNYDLAGSKAMAGFCYQM